MRSKRRCGQLENLLNVHLWRLSELWVPGKHSGTQLWVTWTFGHCVWIIPGGSRRQILHRVTPAVTRKGHKWVTPTPWADCRSRVSPKTLWELEAGGTHVTASFKLYCTSRVSQLRTTNFIALIQNEGWQIKQTLPTMPSQHYLVPCYPPSWWGVNWSTQVTDNA